eukprot:CAMPEP_0180713722 /NCGR_PEP_ID=MMETSP1038_2-20121128/12053_1 /TAXON_ID=632150 /ORGANISM="Azadinium spinosum, Strain 3D9" /LENGTH=352 /DNA_ID=CAMNT_0022746065 /DNA_START=96 /DNA_END=1154 /DNA_ORIENTATION=-
MQARPAESDGAKATAMTQQLQSPFGVLPGSAAIAAVLTYPKTALAEVFFVIIAIATFAIGTLELGPFWKAFLFVVEHVLNAVFFAKYFLRWYARNCRPNYLLKREMLIDAIAGLPLILVVLGVDTAAASWALAFLRLLRTLRLQRWLRDKETFMQLARSVGVRIDLGRFELQLARAVISISTLLFVSSGLMYNAEHYVNPNFPNFFVSLYFGLVTLTTVGFGDITPVTAEGRAIVCVSILVGVALIPVQLSKLTEAFLEKIAGKETQVTSSPARHDAMVQALARQEAQIGDIAQRLDSVGLTGQRELRSPVDESVYCKRCLRLGHLRGAKFCFLCGAPLLDGPNDSAVDSAA